MLSQIISNFLKISTGITQGVPISSPWTYLEQILKLMGQTLVRLKQLKIGTKQSKKIKIHSDLLFKQSEYVRLVATVF